MVGERITAVRKSARDNVDGRRQRILGNLADIGEEGLISTTRIIVQGVATSIGTGVVALIAATIIPGVPPPP